MSRHRSSDGIRIEQVDADSPDAAGRSEEGAYYVWTTAEIESVLGAAGLAPFVSLVVAAEDVIAGKPDPAGYIRALELLDRRPDEAVAFEDSEAGVAAAKAAGLRCIALAGTVEIDRLAGADEIVAALDVELMQRVLG